jgi:nucleoside-diphosphate-sugar epimerase
MTQNASQCLITGTTGYLGGRVKVVLEERGWKVVGLNRGADGQEPAKTFRLGDTPPAASLAGGTALVHCAYDFKQRSWPSIHDVNVAGTEKLFQSARNAGIERLVYVSSISAYEGCRSLYGKAKLETERIAFSAGAAVIRPGLIWGDPPGAMFGKLVEQVRGAKVLPLIDGGSQIQYLVHQHELSEFVARCVEGQIKAPTVPITVAHQQPWTFRQILLEIARAQQKRLSFVPVPWRFVWLALRCAELCRVPINFRSDSLVSLMYQNPNPSFAEQRQLGVSPRPFSL